MGATGPPPVGPWQVKQPSSWLSYKSLPCAALPMKLPPPIPLDEELLLEDELLEELLDDELLDEDELPPGTATPEELLLEEELLDEELELLLDEEELELLDELLAVSSDPPQPVRPILIATTNDTVLKAAFVFMVLIPLFYRFRYIQPEIARHGALKQTALWLPALIFCADSAGDCSQDAVSCGFIRLM